MNPTKQKHLEPLTLEVLQVMFNFQSSSAFVKFASQNGTFLCTTVPFTLRPLIRLNHLRPARAVPTGNFLTLEFDS
jgi:hypothetical protein